MLVLELYLLEVNKAWATPCLVSFWSLIPILSTDSKVSIDFLKARFRFLLVWSYYYRRK